MLQWPTSLESAQCLPRVLDTTVQVCCFSTALLAIKSDGRPKQEENLQTFFPPAIYLTQNCTSFGSVWSLTVRFLSTSSCVSSSSFQQEPGEFGNRETYFTSFLGLQSLVSCWESGESSPLALNVSVNIRCLDKSMTSAGVWLETENVKYYNPAAVKAIHRREQ